LGQAGRPGTRPARRWGFFSQGGGKRTPPGTIWFSGAFGALGHLGAKKTGPFWAERRNFVAEKRGGEALREGEFRGRRKTPLFPTGKQGADFGGGRGGFSAGPPGGRGVGIPEGIEGHGRFDTGAGGGGGGGGGGVLMGPPGGGRGGPHGGAGACRVEGPHGGGGGGTIGAEPGKTIFHPRGGMFPPLAFFIGKPQKKNKKGGGGGGGWGNQNWGRDRGDGIRKGGGGAAWAHLGGTATRTRGNRGGGPQNGGRLLRAGGWGGPWGACRPGGGFSGRGGGAAFFYSRGPIEMGAVGILGEGKLRVGGKRGYKSLWGRGLGALGRGAGIGGAGRGRGPGEIFAGGIGGTVVFSDRTGGDATGGGGRPVFSKKADGLWGGAGGIFAGGTIRGEQGWRAAFVRGPFFFARGREGGGGAGPQGGGARKGGGESGAGPKGPRGPFHLPISGRRPTGACWGKFLPGGDGGSARGGTQKKKTLIFSPAGDGFNHLFVFPGSWGFRGFFRSKNRSPGRVAAADFPSRGPRMAAWAFFSLGNRRLGGAGVFFPRKNWIIFLPGAGAARALFFHLGGPGGKPEQGARGPGGGWWGWGPLGGVEPGGGFFSFSFRKKPGGKKKRGGGRDFLGGGILKLRGGARTGIFGPPPQGRRGDHFRGGHAGSPGRGQCCGGHRKKQGFTTGRKVFRFQWGGGKFLVVFALSAPVKPLPPWARGDGGTMNQKKGCRWGAWGKHVPQALKNGVALRGGCIRGHPGGGCSPPGVLSEFRRKKGGGGEGRGGTPHAVDGIWALAKGAP